MSFPRNGTYMKDGTIALNGRWVTREEWKRWIESPVGQRASAADKAKRVRAAQSRRCPTCGRPLGFDTLHVV